MYPHRQRPTLACLVLCLGVGLVPPAAAAEADLERLRASIDAAYRPGGDAEDFLVPPAADRAHCRLLVRLLHETPFTDSQRLAALADSATALGFALDRFERWHRLVEQDGQRGRGIYFIRPRVALADGGTALVLQAPHARNDKYTERIVASLLLASEAAALQVSTISRWSVPAPAGERHGAADLCHSEATFFQAATQGSCDALPGALVVQLHGYADAKHPALADQLGVLSNGTTRPDAASLAIAARIDRLWPAQALTVYGRDADELGGTTNVQGRWIRRHSDDRFLHLELGIEARRELRDDYALCRRLAAALDVGSQVGLD